MIKMGVSEDILQIDCSQSIWYDSDSMSGCHVTGMYYFDKFYRTIKEKHPEIECKINNTTDDILAKKDKHKDIQIQQKIKIEEKRLDEERIKRNNAIYELKQKVINSFEHLVDMDDKAVVEGIASYLKEIKESNEAQILPNQGELESFKQAAFDKRHNDIEKKQYLDEQKRKEMSDIVLQAICQKEDDTQSILSPKDVAELIQEQFKEDATAKPFVPETIKQYQEKAKEKLKIQEKLSHTEEIAADKYEPLKEIEPAVDVVDTKQALKEAKTAAKKNNKGEKTVISSFDSLAALKNKFNTGK